MRVTQDEPFEVQPRANGAMATALRAATAAALGFGLLGTVLPGAVGTAIAWAAVAVVVVVPLLRITWLALRWVRRGDLLFALLAFTLLVIVSAGAGAALLLR